MRPDSCVIICYGILALIVLVMLCIQMLEVIQLEGHSLSHEDAFMSRDIHLLQVCFAFSFAVLKNLIVYALLVALACTYWADSWLQMCTGNDENAVGACSELVFAPIDEMFPDDAQLLPSGFRVIPLDSKPVELILNSLFLCS